MTAVENKLTVPTAGLVHIKTGTNCLVLTTTNGEIGIRSRVEASVVKEGEVLLSAKTLYSWIQLLADDDVLIEVNARGRAMLKCGNNRSSMGVVNSEFPNLPSTGKPTTSVPASDLARIFSRIGATILGSEDSRFNLAGALFAISGKEVVAVGADVPCLAKASFELAEPIDKDLKVIIPKKAINEIAKLAGRRPEGSSVNLYLGEGGNHLYFGFGDKLFYVRLLAGNFPDYKKAIPNSEGRKFVSVPAAGLRGVLGRVATFADEKSHAVLITLEAGRMTLTSNTKDGDGEESLDVVYSDEPTKIKVNSRFLMEFFRHVGDGEVEFRFKNSASQLDLRIAGDDGYVYVAMPMDLGKAA